MAYNSDNYYKNKIEDQIYRFPNEFKQYANYLIKEKNRAGERGLGDHAAGNLR